ncbi:GNAT family N-acetyltransferase [Streptosporangium sp. NPDC051023]|uniref:GNAT family N-acetyltransferase n=1 Tax=Streptosporangium sp. NPDC051023 TaxID=3155410 RepID=UPI00344F02E4
MSGTSLETTATGFRLRELHHIEEFEDVYRLLGEIWRSDPGSAPIGVELMRALSHAGNYVAGAYRDDRLIGASVAFLAAPAGRALHSHITGTAIGHGIGLALKLHQRAWALERGLDRITWTYDPLVRRNAHFNLAKLGARPTEYLPSFYGVMDDSINAGDESDRVLATWPLTAPHVTAAAAGTPQPVSIPPGTAVALHDHDGHPVPGTTDAPVLLVAVPADIETLRRTDPGAARAWRQAVREILGGLMEQGAQVTGFHQKTSYIVHRPDS